MTHIEKYYEDDLAGRAAVYHDIIQYAAPFFSSIEEIPESPLYPDDTLLEFIGLGGQKIMRLHVINKTSGKYQGVGEIVALRLYNSNEVEIANVGFGTGRNNFLRMIGSCSNGIFVRFGSTSMEGRPTTSSDDTVEFLVTVNNCNKTTIVATDGSDSGSSRNGALQHLYCLSEDDDPNITPIYNLKVFASTTLQIVPFESFGVTNQLVYTQNAFYKKTGLGYCSFSEELNIDNYNYISNGTWVIRDGGD